MQKPEEKLEFDFEEELEKIRFEKEKRLKLEEAFEKIRKMKDLLQVDKAELAAKAIDELKND